MFKEVQYYYFSGTGNTTLALQKMDEIFKEKGVKTTYHAIEKTGNVTEPAPGCAICLAFPANSQSTLPFIWNFFKKMPTVKNVPVFMIMTMNEGAGITGSLYKLLKKKGYIPVGALEVSMPGNINFGGFDEKETDERLEKFSSRVQEFARALVEDTAEWKQKNSGNGFVSFLSRSTPLPWISMRFIFRLKTDHKACTKCGLCLKQCPVQNIVQTKPGEMKHRFKCEFCMRCAAFCPENAIKLAGQPKFVVRSQCSTTL